MSLNCDILLFVATSTEREELLHAANELGIFPSKIKGKSTSEYIDLGMVGESRVMVVQTKMGPLSYRGSASKAINCKVETGATGLIGIGMAFGVDEKNQRIGDILVCRKIFPYDTKNVKTVMRYFHTYDYTETIPFNSNESLYLMFEREALRRSKLQTSSENIPKIFFGAFLSGGSKIWASSFRSKLQRHFSPNIIIGGEMEGIGLTSASDSKKPEWIIVKAISDFADHNREDVIQNSRKIACYNSAKFVLESIKNSIKD